MTSEFPFKEFTQSFDENDRFIVQFWEPLTAPMTTIIITRPGGWPWSMRKDRTMKMDIHSKQDGQTYRIDGRVIKREGDTVTIEGMVNNNPHRVWKTP